MKYDLRKLQLAQLEVLDEFARVCNKNNIVFYLAYGTCLGALRHAGFIPWDDDIDILMPAREYDKLLELSEEFSEEFFLQTYKSDPGFKCAIARLRKNGTACVEYGELEDRCHHGIFIDIYPQYDYPDSKIERCKIVIYSVLYRLLIANRAPMHHGKIINLFGKILLKVISGHNREEKINKFHNKLRAHKNTKYVADLYGMDLTLTKVIKYKKQWFDEPKIVQFENRDMPIPTNANLYMKERYGDYMTLPPLERQKSYHEYAIVSFEHEYKVNVKE